MKKIEAKLETLKIKPLRNTFAVATKEQIRAFELAIGNNLPITYRKFLMKYGISVFDNDVTYSFEETNPCYPSGRGELTVFYGIYSDDLYDLKKVFAKYRGRIIEDLLPIAESPGGDQICIALDGTNKGRIYIWDHTNEILGESDSKNIYMVANSFDDFIESFKVEVKKAVKIKPVSVSIRF